jgi:hypothetical protein
MAIGAARVSGDRPETDKGAVLYWRERKFDASNMRGLPPGYRVCLRNGYSRVQGALQLRAAAEMPNCDFSQPTKCVSADSCVHSSQ